LEAKLTDKSVLNIGRPGFHLLTLGRVMRGVALQVIATRLVRYFPRLQFRAPDRLPTVRLARGPKSKLDVVFYLPSVGTLLFDDGPPAGGGAETQVYLISRELARRGYAVGLICFATDVALPERVHGVHIITRPTDQGNRRIVGAALEALIVFWTIFGTDAAVYVQRIAGFHTGLVALAARLRGRKFMYSSASVMDFDLAAYGKSKRDRLLFRLGVALACAIIVQTEEQVVLCRKRIGREPLLIRSLTDVATHQTTDRSVFLWIGRADPGKRPLDFVAVASAVPHASFNMILLRSGASALEVATSVETAAATVNNLTVSDGLPRAEVGRLIDRAVAVVSTSDYEGMPNVFLEAWTRGVPVLSLNCDPDGVIQRERLGWFTHGSLDQLIDQVRSLWANRTDLGVIAERCCSYMEDYHAPAVVGGQWARAMCRCTGGAL
jgi:glycosyltransferase involved in cell wall biosynthesis